MGAEEDFEQVAAFFHRGVTLAKKVRRGDTNVHTILHEVFIKCYHVYFAGGFIS